MLKSIEEIDTELHPAMRIDGVIYLPVYKRPTGSKCWVGPCGNTYSSEFLAANGARIEMIELWPRQWVKDEIKQLINKNSTYGETKRAYEKAFGII